MSVYILGIQCSKFESKRYTKIKESCSFPKGEGYQMIYTVHVKWIGLKFWHSKGMNIFQTLASISSSLLEIIYRWTSISRTCWDWINTCTSRYPWVYILCMLSLSLSLSPNFPLVSSISCFYSHIFKSYVLVFPCRQITKNYSCLWCQAF